MRKTIETEIEIVASADKVWNILLDFPSYSSWNPFIKEISGPARLGETLRIFIQPPQGKGIGFKPTVLTVDLNREFRWRGRLLIPGLFDGEHYFRIEPVQEGRVRFVHGESFSGILVRFFAESLDKGTLAGFREMNEALRTRAENNGIKS